MYGILEFELISAEISVQKKCKPKKHFQPFRDQDKNFLVSHELRLHFRFNITACKINRDFP